MPQPRPLLTALLALALIGWVHAAPGEAVGEGGPAEAPPSARLPQLIDESVAKLQEAIYSYEEKDCAKSLELYGESIRLAREAEAIDPNQFTIRTYLPIALYNSACCAAILGDRDAAWEFLGQALSAGFLDVKLMREDADLQSLHSDAERWESMLDAAESGHDEVIRANQEVLLEMPAVAVGQPKVGAFVVLHGGGSNAQEIFARWKPHAVRHGFALIAVRGSIVSAKDRFMWDIKTEAERRRVNRLVDETLAANPQIDPARLILCGFSQGATMTYALAAEASRPWFGAIAVAGYLPEELQAKIGKSSSSSIPLQSFFGAKDAEFIVGFNRGLSGHGVGSGPVRVVEWPNNGHDVPASFPQEIDAALAWIQEQQGSGAKP